jgi:NAD(P)-dependent dehydrogenase (short-subunit alcohol dehydrogenase family)
VHISEVFSSIRPRYPELSGKVALVTGSSRGIGKGIALRLGREGMRVVVTSRSADAVSSAAEDLESLGIEVCAIAADLSTKEGIESLFRATIDTFGTIDVLVNNAADLRRYRTENLPEGIVDYQLDANIRAPFKCSVRASNIMKKDRGGSIVNITSVGGLRAHFRGLPYDVCKGAMDSMTRTMAIDLCEYGIRVNSVAPGSTYNKGLIPDSAPDGRHRSGIPLDRQGTPLDIGNAVAFLSSEDASYIIGQIIYVDGGITSMLGTPQQHL